MRRLITEYDILRMAAGSRLEIPPNALVTPAARDAALLRRVQLIEAAAAAEILTSPTSVAKEGCPRCTGELSQLRDGDYLLSVRGGRLSVRRVED